MQKAQNWLLMLLALVVLALIFLDAKKLMCPRGEPLPPASRVTVVKRVADSTPDTLYYPEPVPEWRDTGTTRWRYHPVDTPAIVADYLSRVAYRRVLKDDSSARAVIYDTVTANRLTSYRFEFVNRRPTTIVSHTTTTGHCTRVGWMVGATAGLLTDTSRARLLWGLQITNPRQQSIALRTDPSLRLWQIDVVLPLWRQRKVTQAE